jgi:hypothetical protein
MTCYPLTTTAPAASQDERSITISRRLLLQRAAANSVRAR